MHATSSLCLGIQGHLKSIAMGVIAVCSRSSTPEPRLHVRVSCLLGTRPPRALSMSGMSTPRVRAKTCPATSRGAERVPSISEIHCDDGTFPRATSPGRFVSVSIHALSTTLRILQLCGPAAFSWGGDDPDPSPRSRDTRTSTHLLPIVAPSMPTRTSSSTWRAVICLTGAGWDPGVGWRGRLRREASMLLAFRAAFHWVGSILRALNLLGAKHRLHLYFAPSSGLSCGLTEGRRCIWSFTSRVGGEVSLSVQGSPTFSSDALLRFPAHVHPRRTRTLGRCMASRRSWSWRSWQWRTRGVLPAATFVSWAPIARRERGTEKGRQDMRRCGGERHRGMTV
ncbi:hypothetical protein FB451DRAFT_643377 [Mycena latifolia]|nr:hypothetical protein FB451DRAFT_643377 [Mycena latifolia]